MKIALKLVSIIYIPSLIFFSTNAISDDVGTWVRNTQIGNITFQIHKEGNKYILKSTYWDGSGGNDILIKKNYQGKTRFNYLNDLHGEYFIIGNNGNLGLYGGNGKFDEAVKVK